MLLGQESMSSCLSNSLRPEIDGRRVNGEVLADKRNSRLLQIVISKLLERVVNPRAESLM